MDEVRERYSKRMTDKTRVLDFGIEVLGVYLPEGWKEGHADKHKEYPLTEDFVRKEMLSYLAFAFGKAADHRGISAARSVQKLTEYAWLLGVDELVAFAE